MVTRQLDFLFMTNLFVLTDWFVWLHTAPSFPKGLAPSFHLRFAPRACCAGGNLSGFIGFAKPSGMSGRPVLTDHRQTLPLASQTVAFGLFFVGA